MLSDKINVMSIGKVRINLPLLASQGEVPPCHIHPILLMLLLLPIRFSKNNMKKLFDNNKRNFIEFYLFDNNKRNSLQEH